MTDFLQLAKDRYSVRKFDGTREVSREQIDSILEAAVCAPTAVNNQPFRVWVLTSDDARAKAASATKMAFLAETHVIFAVGAKEDEAWVRQYDGKNFAEVDASIAATQMMLEIHAQGLGTTWVGHFDAPKYKELFPEMSGYSLIALFPVGYPAEDSEPSPRHTEKRPSTELVKEL